MPTPILMHEIININLNIFNKSVWKEDHRKLKDANKGEHFYMSRLTHINQ